MIDQLAGAGRLDRKAISPCEGSSNAQIYFLLLGNRRNLNDKRRNVSVVYLRNIRAVADC
jgi:hypothetical protein